MKESIVHYPWIQYINITRWLFRRKILFSVFSNTVNLIHMVISGPSLAFIGNWVCRDIIQLSVEKRRRRVIYLQWMELMNKNWLIVWHWERNIILKRGTGFPVLRERMKEQFWHYAGLPFSSILVYLLDFLYINLLICLFHYAFVNTKMLKQCYNHFTLLMVERVRDVRAVKKH